MKTIKKLKNNMKTVAGSALLVGATLTAGAAAVSAQDGGSSGDLGDYPAPFVDDDGEVDTTVVVGETAQDGEPVSTADVVSAVEVAGSLGNAAFETTEQTVEVSGSSGEWSAENGVVLDTRNDDVYFGQNIDSVRSTLTDGDLDILSDTEFEDDSGTSYDVTQNLNVGSLPVQFGNNADELDNEDPVLYVGQENSGLPSESSVDNNNYVYNLQASVDSIDLTDEDVAGEEIELFGTEYTIASDHQDTQRDYLKLYGSQQTIDIETGNEETVTINENDHTIEVVSTDASTGSASIRVDGNIRQEDVDSEFTIDGQTVRIEEIINVGSNDDGQGIVELAIGSEELHVFKDGMVEDEDDDDVDGLYAQVNGGDWNGAYPDDAGANEEVSSIDFYVGAEDDDEDALVADETFSHSVMDQVEVHFGGLNPDAAEEGSEVTFSNSGDDTATVDVTGANGDSVSVEFAYDSSTDSPLATGGKLADSDGDNIVVTEGAPVAEDEYVMTDAGDFDHMYEVTSIDRDTTGDSSSSVEYESGDEAEIDLQDAFTGNTVTVDLEVTDGGSDLTAGNDEYYSGTEIIDGQKYHFVLETEDSSGNGNTFSDTRADGSEAEFKVAWGDSSDVTTSDSTSSIDNALTVGDTTLYAAQDTSSGASVAFTDDVQLPEYPTHSTSDTDFSDSQTEDILVDSDATTGEKVFDIQTPTTSAKIREVRVNYTDGTNDYTVTLDLGTSGQDTVTVDDATAQTGTISTGPISVGQGNTVTGLDLIRSTESGTYGLANIATDATENTVNDLSVSDVTFTDSETLELPSTESTDTKTATVDLTQAYSTIVSDTHGSETLPSSSVTAGQTTYQLTTGSGSSDGIIDIAPDDGAGSQQTDPSTLVILPEDNSDNEQAFLVTPGVDDGSDEEMSIGDTGSFAYTGTWNEVNLESDDDMYEGYTMYGAFTEREDDDQGSFTLNIPMGQSTVGAAVTGQDGSLSAEGGASSGTVEASSPTYQYADAALDSEMEGSARTESNLILVGGPSVNSLVQELVDDGQTMAASEYTEGEGMIQMVDGFADGQSALVVAGHSGEDTRAAGEFLADYRNNQEALEGQSQVTVSTETGQVVE